MTYPMKIGTLSCAVNTRQQRKLLMRPMDLGDINVAESDTKALGSLRQVCEDFGFAVIMDRGRSAYALDDCVFGAGSIGPHDDKSMGLTACALLSTVNLSRSLVADDFHDNYESGKCVLFANGQHMHINMGDVFVFNADVKHAWMSNCKWLLQSQAIRRPRSPRRPESKSIVTQQ